MHKPLWERRPARFYFDPGLPDVFSRPYRPYLVNLAVPQTYSDIWGDWYGVFSWSHAHRGETAGGGERVAHDADGARSRADGARDRRLARAARPLGSAPAARTARSSRLLPLAGIAGYLYFTVSYPTPDGDVLKPTYMLSTIGAWALSFGWLADRLAGRSPRLVWGVLGVTALLVLPFVVYKGAVGWF